MSLTKLTKDIAYHQKQVDEPNDVGGLTAAALKVLFDQGAVDIKDYINNTLIPALESIADSSSGADNIGATAITSLDGTTVQAILESLRNKLKATTDNSSGADFVGATGISGLTGTTVQALLEALKSYIDTDFDNKTAISNNRKLSATGDFTGSWHGISSPALADPGIAGVVQSHSEQLADMVHLNKTLTSFTGETIKVVGTFNATLKGSTLTGNPFSDSAKYSLLLDGLENVTIDFARDSKLILDTSNAENPSAILMRNCKNVTIKNLYVEGINQANITEHQLTQGNGVYMVNCDNCYVEKSRFKDTCGGVYIFNSMDCHVVNCIHEIKTDMQVTSPSKKSTGSFIVIGSKNCTIENCDSYGGTGDGNIFLGGGSGQNNCHVINCRVYNYTKGDTAKTINLLVAQGICVDGANKDCSVKSCYIYGFFYGIDVKNYSWSIDVLSNTVKKCYIGITSRPGDQGLTNPDTFSCKIENNIVNPNGGNGSTQAIPSFTSFSQEVIPFGILVHDGYGSLVNGNVIENDTKVGRKDFIHIGVYLEKDYDIDKNQQGIIISNNRFNSYSKRYTESGYSLAKMIIVKGKTKSGNVTIDNNNFTPYYDNALDVDNIAYVNTTSYIVNITNNKISRIKGSVAFAVYNAIMLNFTDNKFDLHTGILYIDSTVTYCNVCNNVSWQQTVNLSNKIYEIKTTKDVVFNGNKYFGRSGAENNFLTISDATCRAIVQNNTILAGFLATSSMLSITTTNKIVSDNVGATGTGALTTITG